MKNAIRTLILALALVGCSPEPEVDEIHQGLTVFVNGAFPGAGVTLAIGQKQTGPNPSNNEPWAVQWTQSGACSQLALNVNHGNALAVDVVADVHVSSFAEVVVLGPGQTKGFACPGENFTLTALNQGGRSVSVTGTPGNDYFNCSGQPGQPVTCNAMNGNDIMDTTGNWNATLQGWIGNDTLRAAGAVGGTGPRLQGGDGIDCLFTPFTSNTGIDCGGGFDFVAGAATITVNCEATTSSCP